MSEQLLPWWRAGPRPVCAKLGVNDIDLACHRPHPASPRRRQRAPTHDTQDFEDADRQIKDAGGRVVWDLDAYVFLDGAAPDTTHASLWRQGQLCAKDGLFEVVPGIYQIRGFDISNVTLVEGESGVIVIDPVTCRETASAAFALYVRHRGSRPVTAVIYTHSHIDHFGGVKGVVSQEEVDAGHVPILAPEGFIDPAMAENVFAGTAMGRPPVTCSALP